MAVCIECYYGHVLKPLAFKAPLLISLSMFLEPPCKALTYRKDKPQKHLTPGHALQMDASTPFMLAEINRFFFNILTFFEA